MRSGRRGSRCSSACPTRPASPSRSSARPACSSGPPPAASCSSGKDSPDGHGPCKFPQQTEPFSVRTSPFEVPAVGTGNVGAYCARRNAERCVCDATIAAPGSAGHHSGRRQRRPFPNTNPRVQAAAAAARPADPAAHARSGARRRGAGRRRSCSATRPSASARSSNAARRRGLALSFALNPDWHLENGVSALAARRRRRTVAIRAADGRPRLRAAGAAAHAAARRGREPVAAGRRCAARDAASRPTKRPRSAAKARASWRSART